MLIGRSAQVSKGDRLKAWTNITAMLVKQLIRWCASWEVWCVIDCKYGFRSSSLACTLCGPRNLAAVVSGITIFLAGCMQ